MGLELGLKHLEALGGFQRTLQTGSSLCVFFLSLKNVS